MFIHKIFAQTPPDYSSIIGTITPPETKYGTVTQGFVPLLSNILRLVFVGAGIFAFINLILAGFQYMSAGGDSKQLTAAWAKIWQSLVGLVIIVGSFAIAALIGGIIFGDPMYILNPQIYGPK